MPGTQFPFSRYVALGDSQTEGVGDGDDVTGLRGWADRLAEHMARHHSGLLYANLAVRGRLAGQVHAEQLAPALALRPDLATVVAGVNDLLRPRFDADEVAGHLEAMFAALTARGTRVATLTFPDASPHWPGPYATASPPSTTASAGPHTGTASPSPRPATTPSSPTPAAGAPAPPNCAGPRTSSAPGSPAAYGAAPRATAARPSAHTSRPPGAGPAQEA